MSDKKNEFANDVLMADIMLRLTAMEKLLIDKSIISKEELSSVTEDLAKRIAKVILEKAQSSKNVNDLISNLENDAKSKKDLKN